MVRAPVRDDPRGMTSADSARPALRRDRERKLVLGVCAGIARVLDTDPAIVRGAAIVLGLFTGPLAVIAYVATAAVVPRDDGRMLLGGDPPDKHENILGWAAIAIACVLLLAAAPAFDAFWIERPLSGPLLAAALIAGVIVLARANRERTKADRTAATMAAAGAPPSAAATGPSPASEAPTEAVEASQAPTSALLPATRVMPGGGFRPPTDDDDTLVSPPPPPPPSKPRGRSVFLMVAGVLVAAAAVIVVLDVLGVYDLSATGVAVALGAGALTCGVAAAVAAGRRGAGATLAVGIVLALGAAGVAALGDQFEDGVGVKTIRPAAAVDIKPEYRQGVGVLELDLRETRLPDGVTPVKAELGFGEIQVRVAPDVRVESVGATDAGGDLDPRVVRAGGPAPVVRLDAHTDVGAVRVIRDGG
ncbi:MAG: PspC domain-containing protein [Candidatus Binatia bacterium]